ncbi:MAG: LCP family protein [Firmicutes bacterium]|nr:LCP family protein [Candidatus Caballimonas caccae]
MIAKKSKLIIKIIAIALSVIAGITIIVGIIVYQKIQKELEPAFTPTQYHLLEYNGKTYKQIQDRKNVLLIGIDTAEEIDDTDTIRSRHMCDFLCLLSFDMDNNKCTAIHINRDTMTNVSMYNKYGVFSGEARKQIAYAYSYGYDTQKGSIYTCKTVSEFLKDIRIDFYATINFDAIATINDFVGGVEVDITDDFSNIDSTMKKGKMTLHGKQAEYFVRSRHHVGSQTNLERMERQRVYMQAFFNKFKDTDKSVTELYGLLKNQLVTSCDINLFQKFIDKKKDFELEIKTIPGVHQNLTGYAEYIIDDNDLNEVLIETLFKEVK